MAIASGQAAGPAAQDGTSDAIAFAGPQGRTAFAKAFAAISDPTERSRATATPRSRYRPADANGTVAPASTDAAVAVATDEVATATGNEPNAGTPVKADVAASARAAQAPSLSRTAIPRRARAASARTRLAAHDGRLPPRKR